MKEVPNTDSLILDIHKMILYSVHSNHENNFVRGKYSKELFGIETDKMPITTEEYLNFIFPEDREQTINKWNENISAGVNIYETEYRIQHIDGTIKWVKDTCHVIRNKSGEVERKIGTIVDISQYKEHEIQLVESQKWLNIVLDNLNSSVFIKNTDLKYILYNKYVEKTWHIAPGEFIGKSAFDLFPKDIAEQINKTDKQTLAQKSPQKLTVKTEFPDGPKKTTITEKIPLFDHNNKIYGLLGITTDITELADAKEKIEQDQLWLNHYVTKLENYNEELVKARLHLKETQNQLVQSEKMASMGILTAGIAHEINNPINYISGGIAGLKKCIQKLTHYLIKDTEKNNSPQSNPKDIAQTIDSAQIMIGSIEKGISRVVNIIESISNFSRDASNHFIEVNINKLLDSTLLILYSKYKNNIKIIKNYHNKDSVYGLPTKLNQVFMNIISNAIDSIDGRGNITIKTWWEENDDTFIISIKDNGTGIPEKIKDKIFNPFFTTKNVGKGTGLGLYISYQVIENHYGTIEVNSQKGKGSEFIIRLPKNDQLASSSGKSDLTRNMH
ncbi:PAS domain-containing sensor histidine kinase [Saccharicrinis sp. 156]|uniref:PAS domain-containing sensor histidine kinase n=1 Tax=Saccharicrinis sp. 156 TaxID=3417574 RepID=UPI003D32F9E1